MDPKVQEVYEAARTARAASYKKFIRSVAEKLQSESAEDVEMRRSANEAFSRVKALGPAAVHQDATLSTLSVQYRNGDYIGEMLMPVAPVNKLSDVYYKYDKRSRLAYPDDAIATRGEANEIADARSTDTYSCRDYGLKNSVDVQMVENADAPLNEMVDLVEATAEGVAFKREARIAAIVSNAANYATANKVTLAGANIWTSAGGGTPVKDIQTARAALWQGRGPGRLIAWSNLEVYNVLARHPAILDLFKYSKEGLATPQQIASYFMIDDYLVSEARYDTANEGAAASYSRIWGAYFGITRVAERPTIRNASFGYTMRKGPVTTDQWFDLTKGRKGSWFCRVSCSEDHKVVAADTSYLITTGIS